jgi:hypothetical protein
MQMVSRIFNNESNSSKSMENFPKVEVYQCTDNTSFIIACIKSPLRPKPLAKKCYRSNEK